MKQTKFLILSIAFVLSSCGGGSSKSESNTDTKTESRDEIRLRQYKVEGAKIYATYCQACHQQDGKGLANLYPPLAGSDYLLEDLPRATCIIKNGQNKEIVVNGQTYNQMMPANPISNLEVAEVLTFITNTWGNEKGLISVKDIDDWISACEK